MMHFTNSRHPPKPPPIPLSILDSDPFYPNSTDNLLPKNTQTYPYIPLTPESPSNGLNRRKSILKIPKMDITWDDPSHHDPRPITPNTPNPKKLQKQPKKGVRFTPSTTGEGDFGQIGFSGLPTPDPTPEKVNTKSNKNVKKKPSWIHWPFVSTQNQNQNGNSNDFQNYRSPTLNDTPSPTGSDTSWHHHSSYFPEYTPIYPTPPSIITPSVYALSAAEIQAQEHSSRVGHSVQVHYPMLPSWSEYGGQQDKSENGWQSTTTNHALTSGWNGFGWNEDKLPKSNELTFGKPAPVGEPLEGAKKKKNKKKKKKGGAGGGGGAGGDEGGDDDEEGGEGEGGDEDGG